MPTSRTVPALLTSILVVGAALALVGCSTTTGGAPLVTTTVTTAANALPVTTTTSEPAASEGKQFFVYAPVEGDCIDLRSTGDGGAATTQAAPDDDATPRSSSQLILRLDCQLPHQYEVIAVVPAGLRTDPPPDDAALIGAAKQLCPPAFATYVGASYQSSALELGWILPNADQRRLRNLQIGCLAFDPEGKLTGSVRGSGR